MPIRKILRRECKCGKMFVPNGRFSRVCSKCIKKNAIKVSKNRKAYWEKKRNEKGEKLLRS